MRKLLVSAALLASSIIASPAMAVASFQSDVLAWQTINPGYIEDTEYGAQGTSMTSLTLDDGTQLGFVGSVTDYTVGSGWATWCCSYTGDVLWSEGATSVAVSFLTGVDGFGFYAQPNPFATYLITLGLSDGGTLIQSVSGSSGAKFFGFTGSGVTSMTVSSTADFAIGDFFVRPAVPEPATWGMMLLGFGAMGMAFRRNRKASKPLAQLA